MGLKTYMIISSSVNLLLFFTLSLLADHKIEGTYPREFLILCPLVIAMFQFSAVLPRARSVPVDERIDLWAYREANKPTIMILLILIFSGIVLLFDR